MDVQQGIIHSTKRFLMMKTMINQSKKMMNPRKRWMKIPDYIMRDFVDRLSIYSIMDKTVDNEVRSKQKEKNVGFRVQSKNFFAKESIFEACSELLTKMNDGTFEYNTDGLIFTPALYAVGGNEEGGSAGPLYKTTWDYSFKWKPPQFNTIDFLVSVKKDKAGRDEIHNIFQEGTNLKATMN